MNKTRVKDLASKRRKYLGKKTGANLFGIVFATITVGIGCIALFLIATAIATIFYIDRSAGNFPPLALLTTIVSAGSIFTGLVSASMFKKARTLNYVPPIAEQIAALPAEEILVRSSDQPIAVPAELLRAAHAGTAALGQELLRESTAPTYAPDSDDG